MKKFVLRPSQKLKTLQRGSLIIASVSVVVIAIYIFIGIGASRSLKSSAQHEGLLVNDPVNNGMIICGFSFENANDIKKSDTGPSAISISRNAEIVTGGNHNSMGLSAGNTGRNIHMTLPADAAFNTSGIDISIDFRRFEESASFISRGNYFSFGMKDGMLCIKYRLKSSAKTINVDEITKYEIPSDSMFRSYRFIYNPEEAKGEIFVDNVPVWSVRANDGFVLSWNDKDEVIIGEEMNGGSNPVAIIDNLVIRSTMPARSMPLHLLSFTAEYRTHDVMLNWFTAKEDGTDYFRVERSSDTHNYEEIGRVKAAGRSNELKAYALVDPRPQQGVTYYRLSMPNTDIRSVWVPVIALRIKQEMLPAMPTEKTSSLMQEYIKE